jgi:hypothetical protein
MVTAVVKTVGSAGGRDYSTLTNFLLAVPTNLVTADQQWTAELYNDSEFAAGFVISNGVYTTDATRYIKITAAAGQSFKDHASVRTNPQIYDQSKGVGFALGASNLFTIDCSNTVIERLQIKRTAANGTFSCMDINSGAGNTNIIIKDCLLQKNSTGSAPVALVYSTGCKAINCTIIDNGAGTGHGLSMAFGNATALNCTIVQTTANAAHGVGLHVSSGYGGSVVVRNCAVFGFNAQWDNAPAGATTGYNCSSGTCPSGSNNQNTKTYANQFESTLNDFRLKTGSDCEGTGSTDATLAPNDISGFTRGVGTAGDIGSWEFGTSGTTHSGIAAESATATDAVVTLQMLVPSADTSVGGWTALGGGTIFSKINEAVQDNSNYGLSSSSPTNDAYLTKLSSGSTPVATGAGFHVLDYAISSIGAGSSAVVKLWQGNRVTLVATRSHGVVSQQPTWDTYALVLTAAEYVFMVDFTDLYVEVIAS